jgi:hypothetical protein
VTTRSGRRTSRCTVGPVPAAELTAPPQPQASRLYDAMNEHTTLESGQSPKVSAACARLSQCSGPQRRPSRALPRCHPRPAAARASTHRSPASPCSRRRLAHPEHRASLLPCARARWLTGARALQRQVSARRQGAAVAVAQLATEVSMRRRCFARASSRAPQPQGRNYAAGLAAVTRVRLSASLARIHERSLCLLHSSIDTRNTLIEQYCRGGTGRRLNSPSCPGCGRPPAPRPQKPQQEVGSPQRLGRQNHASAPRPPMPRRRGARAECVRRR